MICARTEGTILNLNSAAFIHCATFCIRDPVFISCHELYFRQGSSFSKYCLGTPSFFFFLFCKRGAALYFYYRMF